MGDTFSFFNRGQAEKVSPEAAKNIGSPEVLGRALITAIKLWIEHALSKMPTNRRMEIDTTFPEDFDCLNPESVITEFHRLAAQIAPYMPAEVIMEELTADEVYAAEVMYRVRMLSDTLKEVQVSAPQAILIIERSLILGIRVAEAHVSPFESFAAIQYKAQNSLINHNRNSPTGSPNALKAEESSREHEKWIRSAANIWQVNNRLSANQVARRVKNDLSLDQKADTIRKVISKSRR